jgi:hypothetical protein
VRTVNDLLHLKYSENEHPKVLKQSFLEIKRNLSLLKMDLPEAFYRVIWMNAIPQSLSVLKQGMIARPSMK